MVLLSLNEEDTTVLRPLASKFMNFLEDDALYYNMTFIIVC